MKKIWIAKKLLVMACVALCGVFLNCGDAFAHELFYDGSTTIAMRWNDVSNRVARLKVNSNSLDSNYLPCYADVKSAWNQSPRVTLTDTTIANSNVDMATYREKEWNEFVGNANEAYFTMGLAVMTTTDNVEVRNMSDAKRSSKKFRYARVVFNPSTRIYSGTIQRKLAMVHEIGHVLGLGHPDDRYNITNVKSVMRSEADGDYYTLQQHDKNDLDSMY